MLHYTFTALLGLLATQLAHGADPNISAAFSKPAAPVRPRFRYWLPDAGVDVDAVLDDIASAASIGAGGLELVPFYEYGGQLGPMPTGANWSTYNFGTPAFNNLFEKMLEAHYKHGLVMDFALGPNQGQGVPASPNDEGLQWDLVPFTQEVSQNGSLYETVPGWGSGNLVSLVSALVKSNQSVTYQAIGILGLEDVSYQEYRLVSGTLIEHTTRVDRHGRIKLSFPAVSKGSHYRVFAFYEKLAGHKNLDFSSITDVDIFDNGSYTVDHFSSKGAEVIAKFWEQHILVNGIPQLLSTVGNYAWEDSLEMTYNISWSQSLPELFENTTGYSIKPYLPLMSFQQNNMAIQSTAPGSFKCVLDTDDEGIGYVNDFRATLVEGYKQFLSTMASWVHKTLHVQLSVQPAYGFVMDMLSVIPSVDAPECESLSFKNNVDLYRSFSGPARLAGRRVVSNEMGAVRGAGFRYHLPDLIFSINRAFLGGINQNILHGQAFSGRYHATTWPGHVPFGYLFSDPLSPMLPIWSHGLKNTMNYMARVQHILQNSVAKADVAIYNKQSATTIETTYQANDLVSEGWSWNYLSADNLGLEESKVEDGILAPNGPAWKSFVIESSHNITIDAIASLRVFAQHGLPVIISGGQPNYYETGSGSQKAKFDNELSKLLEESNVHSVDTGKVAGKLTSLGLRPRVGVTTNGTCYTSWSEVDGVGYALVYSDLLASVGNLSVTSTKRPFYLDPWTGEISPALVYKRTATTTTIPFNLAGNQTLLLAFGDDLEKSTTATPYHIEEMPSHILGYKLTDNGGISLHVSRSETPSDVVLSDGTKVTLDATLVPSAFQLSKWNLTAEHWEAPEDFNDSNYTVKYNTSHVLDAPTSWSEISSLMNATGIGYYTTTFEWPSINVSSGYQESLGAYIRFSKVLDSVTVAVNGHEVPPLDITNAVADITQYLRNGQNIISVTVPTTMWNYIRTILSELRTAGSEPIPLVLSQIGSPIEPRTDAGLVGTVTIVPYQAELI